MSRLFKRLAIMAAVVSAAFGMAALGTASLAAAQPPPPPPATVASIAPALTAYRMGAGDKLRITTYGEPSLTGEFFVSGAGTVSFPLIGEIKASGQTTSELKVAIETALKDGFLKDPNVSVEVLNYRPFYILGEVAKPGEYPYTNGLTVLNAVATANGFTYRADKKHVYIRRANDTAEQRLDLDQATVVLPGDTIRIGERYF